MAEAEEVQNQQAGEAAESRGDGEGTTETSKEGAGNGTSTEGTIPDEVDVLRRENARLTSEADHFKRAHDELGGKVGPEMSRLRNRVSELESGGSSRGEFDDDHSEGRRTESTPMADPRVEQLLDREESKAKREDQAEAKQAYSDAVNKFDMEFPNLDKSITKDVGKFVHENMQEILSAIEAGDSRNVGFVTDRLLTRAMKHAIAERRKTNSSAEQERQERLAEQKRDASTPGRQGPGTGIRRGGGPMSVDATLEEIQSEMRRRGRKGF